MHTSSQSTHVLVPRETEQVIAVFAPTRSRIANVTLDGFHLRPSVKNSFVWIGAIRAGETSIAGWAPTHVESVGERPVLLKVVALAGRKDMRHLNDAGEACADSEWAALLHNRAMMDGEMRQMRRFFFHFDAWTNTALVAALTRPSFVRLLSTEALSVFADNPPPAAHAPCAKFSIMALRLLEAATSRPYYMLHGSGSLPSPEVLSANNIRSTAAYLWSVFERVPRTLAAVPAAKVLEHLEVAFASFAAGHLAFIPADSQIDPLNAEPDSAWFFALAEFAFRACELGAKPGRELWYELARMFVVLIEPFSMVYGSRLGVRGACAYTRSNRRDIDRPTVAEIRDLVGHQRKLIPHRQDLTTLEHLYKSSMLWAVADDVIHSRLVRPPGSQRCDEATFHAPDVVSMCGKLLLPM